MSSNFLRSIIIQFGKLCRFDTENRLRREPMSGAPRQSGTSAGNFPVPQDGLNLNSHLQQVNLFLAYNYIQ